MNATSSFIKEVLSESVLGDEFNSFRRLRNSINYYGKEVDVQEAKSVLKNIKTFIVKIKKFA